MEAKLANKVSVNKSKQTLPICRRPIKNGVLRKLKHIFPNTYQRINSICSPAKVGLVVTDFNYQPGS